MCVCCATCPPSSFTMNSNDPTKTLYSDPPFSSETQLNDDPLGLSLIPGEYTPLKTAFDFLHDSLSQAKANAIFRHLWFAGTPRNFRALHEQFVFRRKIIP